MTGSPDAALADHWETAGREIVRARFRERVVLLSPPRTGSTPISRLLWRHPELEFHCHEPFEAAYWGGCDQTSILRSLSNPMRIDTGERVAAGEGEGETGLVIKEMTFQLDRRAFDFLISVATKPILFVVRDPRLCVASRLKIVRELRGDSTFAPAHSGWDALNEQIAECRARSVPHIIIDSQRLRREPARFARLLAERIGFSCVEGAVAWEARTGLQLCAPEVGMLMGDVRAESDPFYRRVLASTGIQPPDDVDLDAQSRAIAAAGLTGCVAAWMDIYDALTQAPEYLT